MASRTNVLRVSALVLRHPSILPSQSIGKRWACNIAKRRMSGTVLRRVGCQALLRLPAHPSPLLHQARHFLPGLPSPFGGNKGTKLEYTERVTLGYSMDQMYNVVSNVEEYKNFVPFCQQSSVERQRPGTFNCTLTVGFPPVVEKYTSVVTVKRPTLVRSVAKNGLLFEVLDSSWRFSAGLPERPDTCTLEFFAESNDGTLLKYLLNEWQFFPGIPNKANTCRIQFKVIFEFRSRFHSVLAQNFFDQVVKQMVKAFLKRAETLYGPQSIRAQRSKVLLQSS